MEGQRDLCTDAERRFVEKGDDGIAFMQFAEIQTIDVAWRHFSVGNGVGPNVRQISFEAKICDELSGGDIQRLRRFQVLGRLKRPRYVNSHLTVPP